MYPLILIYNKFVCLSIYYVCLFSLLTRTLIEKKIKLPFCPLCSLGHYRLKKEWWKLPLCPLPPLNSFSDTLPPPSVPTKVQTCAYKVVLATHSSSRWQSWNTILVVIARVDQGVPWLVSPLFHGVALLKEGCSVSPEFMFDGTNRSYSIVFLRSDVVLSLLLYSHLF